MRILHISSARTYGGGEKHLVDLTGELTRRGHDVFVALRPTNEWQNRLDFLPPENILHVSIRNSFGVFSAQKIANFVRENNIRIIHAHLGRDYIPASLVCRMTQNTKFVLTRHVLFPMRPFHRLALRNLSKAIAVSPAVETNLRKIFPAAKIEIVPNGIDVERFEASSQKLREEFRFLHDISFEATVVGIVGELKVLKGQRDFILAAHLIARKFPGAFFVVVGKDNTRTQEFRRELKKLVRVFGLDDRFLWLNWVDDMPALLAAMDVFVSASYTESFGLALLEAMAAGLAVVATETEGARELIENETTGRLVAVKEPIGMADAVGELLQNEELRKTLGRNARKVAREKFDLARMIDETERVYKNLQ